MTHSAAVSVVAKSAVKKPVRSAAKATSRVKKPVVVTPVLDADGVPVPAAPKRRRAKAEVRTRIYWAVFNVELKRVAVFGFDQKVEAEKRVEKLIAETGERHFVQKLKVVV
jgi:hypothetical protein